MTKSPNMKVIKLSDHFWWLMANLWLCSVLWPLTGIDVKDAVFVAFAGEDLSIQLKLSIPANQMDDFLTCFDPLDNQILKFHVPGMQNQSKHQLRVNLTLKRLERSGEYMCRYKTAEVFLFLYVRGMFRWQYTIIVIIIFSGWKPEMNPMLSQNRIDAISFNHKWNINHNVHSVLHLCVNREYLSVSSSQNVGLSFFNPYSWSDWSNCLCSPGDGYRDQDILDYSLITSVAVFCAVLLVFSVVGSAFVLRNYLVRFLLILNCFKFLVCLYEN